MLLEGSCHCRAVRFRVESAHPYPFNFCYCGICRKTAGAGGYAINISAAAQSLAVEGKQYLSVYRARLHRADGDPPEKGHAEDPAESPAERNFCSQCGSPLWLWDPRWPELLHPHASSIDTELPTPPERTHLMLDYRAAWVEPWIRKGDKQFSEYPDESIAAWHERLGLENG